MSGSERAGEGLALGLAGGIPYIESCGFNGSIVTERHAASTVGEDMELVVRLHEHMRKKRIPYKVFDAFNANCWTEVPDSFKVLHRQRDRWHRGLIETILLHKNMIFNPRYGPIGRSRGESWSGRVFLPSCRLYSSSPGSYTNHDENCRLARYPFRHTLLGCGS